MTSVDADVGDFSEVSGVEVAAIDPQSFSVAVGQTVAIDASVGRDSNPNLILT